jgi:putative redox protein
MSITARSLANYQVEITAGNHTFISDEPLGVGDDAGPSPYDLLLAGLGSCVVITLHMYARRKNWPLERVEIALEHSTVPASECPDCRSARPDERIMIIEKKLTFFGDLSAEQINRLLEISDRCPVNRTLMGEIKIRTSLLPTGAL